MGCLLDYPYFKENYRRIAIDFSKQQVLDADPRVIQECNFSLLKKQQKLSWTSRTVKVL